jgi:hypothetical protein
MWKEEPMARFVVTSHHFHGVLRNARDISARIARGAVHSTATFGGAHQAGALNQPPFSLQIRATITELGFGCFDYSLTPTVCSFLSTAEVV